jgi:uncharacterized protein (TIGR03086 family)
MSADLGLLQQAAGYALAALDVVTPELLSRPTPCSKWNLSMLLSHECESVTAFQEALDGGRVGLFSTDDCEIVADPTGCLRLRVTCLLDEWAAVHGERTVAVADHRIPLSLMAGAAALEIAVHGWDVFEASGHDRPIPVDLAADLLASSHELVRDDNRHGLFAAPVATSESAGPSERLLAFLGRRSATVRAITRKAS